MRVLRADSLLGPVTASKKEGLTAYVDGASRGNPGPAAFGVVLQDPNGKTVKTLSQRIGSATNNTAEYYGLISALQEALIMGARDLRVFTDSELLAKQFSGQYKVKEESIKRLFLLVQQLRRGFQNLEVKHVPREQNKLADSEANRALDEEFFL